MRGAAVLKLVCLVGYDYALRLDHVDEPRTDAPASDGSTPDGVEVMPCEAPLLDERFHDGIPCNSWATPQLEDDCTMSEDERGLVIMPMSTYGSC